MRPIVWHGDSLSRIRSFPDEARQDTGYQLQRVQIGLQPRDCKPMPDVGSGVLEVRVHMEGEFRVFYLAKLRGRGACAARFPEEVAKDQKG